MHEHHEHAGGEQTQGHPFERWSNHQLHLFAQPARTLPLGHRAEQQQQAYKSTAKEDVPVNAQAIVDERLQAVVVDCN